MGRIELCQKLEAFGEKCGSKMSHKMVRYVERKAKCWEREAQEEHFVYWCVLLDWVLVA